MTVYRNWMIAQGGTDGWRERLHRFAHRFVHGTTPSWRRTPNELPWFDRPDAAARLAGWVAAGTVDATLATQLRQWMRDGYVVLDGLVPAADIDEMLRTLEGLWDAADAIAGLELCGVRDEPLGALRNVAHAELVTLPAAQRVRMRELSDWRIHGFHHAHPAARRIFSSAPLRAFVARLLDRPVQPIASINFMQGSQQALHQDMAVFHIHPHNFLVGAWIACEDVGPAQGPLVFHPGSHRAGLFAEFVDYPQLNLRTGDPSLADRYQRWVDGLATAYPRHEFHARKGQVLLWHGALFHGGAPVLDRTRSRKSMVLHYAAEGADRAGEVTGPFNW